MRYSFITLILLAAAVLSPVMASAVCTDSVPVSTPDYRFTDNGNGTVTDVGTGLTWKRCSEGQTWSGATCTGTATQYTWLNALTAGANSTFVTKNDWRIPNVKELASIIERKCYAPSINETIFPATPIVTNFWTSTPTISIATSAWKVNFYYGATGSIGKTTTGYARLVRGGQ